ncbi:hypothetical protein RS3R2_13930 [Pseudomonas lactis]|nr:hypothetical protein RS3R2_13930 [Pseudomonas lactis]
MSQLIVFIQHRDLQVSFKRAIGNHLPCRSELAREELKDTAGYQEHCVIVDDFREQARSYRVV